MAASSSGGESKSNATQYSVGDPTYYGTIAKVNTDGTYDIKLEDGEIIKRVPYSKIEHDRNTVKLDPSGTSSGTDFLWRRVVEYLPKDDIDILRESNTKFANATSGYQTVHVWVNPELANRSEEELKKLPLRGVVPDLMTALEAFVRFKRKSNQRFVIHIEDNKEHQISSRGFIGRYFYALDDVKVAEKPDQLRITTPAMVVDYISEDYYNVTIKSTSVDEAAFNRCEGLKSVTFPEGLTDIGYGAFSGCFNLGKGGGRLTFPPKLTSIGYFAFADCKEITSITFTGDVTIHSNAFAGCDKLTSVTSSEGTIIEVNAFPTSTIIKVNAFPPGTEIKKWGTAEVVDNRAIMLIPLRF